MNAAKCSLILKQYPALARDIVDARRLSKLPRRHAQAAERCGAYLWASGWVGIQREVTGDRGGYITEDEIIERRREWAIRDLQKAGVLPTGLMWALSFVFRWAMTRFIEYLIRNWILPRENQVESK